MDAMTKVHLIPKSHLNLTLSKIPESNHEVNLALLCHLI